MKTNIKIALFWLVGLTVVSLIALKFFLSSAQAIALSGALEAPSLRHIFGTDALGRDIFLRIMCGGAISLGVGFAAVGLSLAIGILIGALSGYFGGWVDRLCMAAVDIFLCFPIFFLILAVVAVLGPSLFNVMIVIGATSWMGTARLLRSEILTLKEREFVLASRTFGAGPGWIITKHLLPNAMGPVVVNGILGISGAILTESALSFLGIGVQPPTPSWGNILADGRTVLGVAWWVTFFPGFMIFITVLAVNTIGEELRS